jgi:hypothetical protein
MKAPINAELDQKILDREDPSGEIVLDTVYNFLGRFVAYPPSRCCRRSMRDAWQDG